ncbi:MAG: DUF5320 domain-containing protein [Bacteroidales bacterium]|nr:DUF5320 domain-containing protein [Bacteroidales bacterium]
MPRRDQTGPEGMGQMTGRRMGICAGGQKQESYLNFGLGRGFRGRQNMRFTSSHNQTDSLQRNQNSKMSNKEFIESEIENLKERLLVLESELENLS